MIASNGILFSIIVFNDTAINNNFAPSNAPIRVYAPEDARSKKSKFRFFERNIPTNDATIIPKKNTHRI